jgi:hypothetical protein
MRTGLLRLASFVLVMASLALGTAALGQNEHPVTGANGTAPPITINSCGPIINNNNNSTTSIAGIPIPASTSSGIQIEFVNESNKTATLVNFAVHSAGDHFVIRDVGTFSPGVSITHQFKNGQGQAFVLPAFISPNVTCHVTSVKFADGSVWEQGEPPTTSQPVVEQPASTKPALNVSPAQLTMAKSEESQLFLVTSSANVAAFKETDNCGKIATILVAVTADSSATYQVKPMATGSCSARVTDDQGNGVTIPIVIQ